MGHFKLTTKQVDGQLMHISEQCSAQSRTVLHAGQTSVPLQEIRHFHSNFAKYAGLKISLAQRALELLPDIYQYVSKKKQLPGSVTCEI